MSLSESIKESLEDYLQQKILKSNACAGGTICESYKILLENKKEYFLKTLRNAPQDLFLKEALSLEIIRSSEAIRVPEVVKADQGFLLLEYIPEGSQRDYKELGQSLAKLHQIQGEKFGFETDNYIGLTPQQNTRNEDWAEFFIESRLGFQMSLAIKENILQNKDQDIFEEKKATIQEKLSLATKPSLLHGDLWTGNIYWSETEPVLIDPTVYYGSNEADLAMTEMFGSLPQEFYAAYHKVIPEQFAYAERKEIYNLYHLLNHANIFGGGYVRQVRQVLSNI